MTTNVLDTMLCIGINVLLSVTVLLLRDCIILSFPETWRRRIWVVTCVFVIVLVLTVWALSLTGMLDRRNILVY
jgi:hypothetical protein